MASDASHMLEAALEQMDDIIAGGFCEAFLKFGAQSYPSQGSDSALIPALTSAITPDIRVVQLVEDLRVALEGQVDQESMRRQIPIDTAQTLLEWLEKGGVNQQSPVNGETNQERLTRLEGDKESLVLQVSVLTDQVEAQGVKISDLESSLEEHQHKLNSTEEMLQQECLSRTSLESQKLDLMGEVSYLKLKLVDMEEKQIHGVERQHKAESVVNLISELQEQMCRFQQEINCRIREKTGQADSSLQKACDTGSTDAQNPDHGLACDGSPEEVILQELRLLKEKVDHLEDQKSQYERRLKATKAELSDLQQLLLSKNAEIDSLHTQLLARPLSTETSEREDMYRRRLNNKHQELQRLKTGMETLLVANDEKDRRIEELTLLLVQYRQFRDVVTPRQAPPTILSISNESTPSNSSEEREHGVVIRTVPPSALPENKKAEMSFSSSSPQLVSHLPAQKERELWTHPRLLSSSMDNLQNGSSLTHVVVIPVEAEVSENGPVDNRCQTLPVKGSLPEHNGEGECSETQSQRSPEASEDGDSRKTEKMDDTSSSDLSPQSSGAESGQRTIGSPEHLKNNNSIRKLWGKIRRTQSGGLQGEDLEPNHFRRGGLRATAGPRLTRTPESGSTVRDMNTPFSQWTREQVCGWLEDYGLGQYVNLTRQWVDNGQTLLSARPQDFEKEMGLKHPLHRKKLQLALRGFSTKAMEKSSELDHIWVTRWLDDIGLPQYKDQFHEGRVDGRMLQYLTVNDLLFLKVTSQLHHLSIKCAIHVLHVNKFNPHCLRRRPGEERNPSPSEVIQWSNHRVMEWLRAVDLAEYAPNLRGSGVHGGLIILELRFSSETLAMLLNIPPQKTLLRRHLATAFTALVGTQASLEKREYANATGHAPLTTAAKVRPKKLGFTHFSHLRKRRPDDLADYICPIDSGGLSAMNGVSHRPYVGVRGLSPILDREPERREQVGPKS
ncbi:liprin-beta-2 isoform X1 [Salmo salar]|uniref:Liprin-beta-2 isoform X1 n=1 Tax=Salmo salar TaxID=8030 RepID=A0A1S3PUI1_SALSA|nr:liprin-beta-2-like isoform X1 [Salmo salar]|eukprot:XP_014031337.1 PREDICTED: liprin-beta-2-like isoform X1 [Salmo salar]